MKKRMAGILGLILAISLTGCGGGENDAPASSKDSTSQAQTEAAEQQEYSTDKITCLQCLMWGEELIPSDGR